MLHGWQNTGIRALIVIEGDELSIIFFFFIRAGTKVPASFHLWSIFFHSLIIEIRNKAF